MNDKGHGLVIPTCYQCPEITVTVSPTMEKVWKEPSRRSPVSTSLQLGCCNSRTSAWILVVLNSFAEFFAIALEAKARVAALWIVQCPVVPAVRAVFLASHLARNRLVRRADLVSHMVHKLVPSYLCPDDDDLILWNPDGFVTLGTKIHAQW